MKIISPECANVDQRGMSYIQNIKDDPAALADLAGFAIHSANMSFTPEYYDLCNVPGKESWQTEGDANGPQSINDAGLAAKFAAKACNDFNFGANVWMHFVAYLNTTPTTTPRGLWAMTQTRATTSRFSCIIITSN